MRSLKEIFPPRAAYALLPLRLVLFATFFYHGTGKLFGWFGGGGVDGTAAFLAARGIPLATVLAFAVAILECVGSVSFLVGAGTRFFSIVLGTMVLAKVILVYGPNGWSFKNLGVEFQFVLLGALMTLLFQGPGAGSIEWADEEGGAAPRAVS